MELEWWRWVLLGAGVLLLLGVMVLKGIIIPLFFRKKNLVKLSPTPYDSEMDGKKRLVFAVSKLLPEAGMKIDAAKLTWACKILCLKNPEMKTKEDIATATRDLQISIRQFVWMMIRIVDFSPPYGGEMEEMKRLVFAVSKLLPDTNTEINKSNLAWIYQILALDVPVMDTEEDIATATRDLQISIRQFVWMMIRIVDFSPAKKNLVKLSPTPYDSEMDGKKRLVFAVSKLLPDTNTEINKSNLAWIYQILALDVPVMDTEEDIATATRDLQISIRQFVWMMIRIVDFSPAKK